MAGNLSPLVVYQLPVYILWFLRNGIWFYDPYNIQVFGGSWGSTLALAYSQTHPDKVYRSLLIFVAFI
jgi:pimeloyl-ACP methyl ester carboxylesterase